MTKLEIKDEENQDDNHDHDVQDDQDHEENHSDNRGYKIDTDADHDENDIDTGEDTDIRTDTVLIRMTASIMPKHLAGDMDPQTNNDQ